MEHDESQSRTSYPLSTAKMSKTPSWIMLGFVLGAAFVVALPQWRRAVAPPTPALARVVEDARPATPREPPQLSTIEAVFALYGGEAVWSDDVTEVALWNSSDRAFSEFYEVRRMGGVFYFRTIPRLTRRVIARGKPRSDMPLQFTETEDQYREWLAFGRTERPADPAPNLRPAPAPQNVPALRYESNAPQAKPEVFPRDNPPVLNMEPSAPSRAGGK